MIKQKIFSLAPNFLVRKYLNYKSAKEIKKYVGENVNCPICKSSFRIFASFGNPIRENAKCPKCDSSERLRLMWLYLHQKTDLFTNTTQKKILHFAPEKSLFCEFLKLPYVDYVPCDLFPTKYVYGRNVKVTKVDITNIPFENNTFDIILCSHVLEHIPDDALAMSELYRVLKPGGWGIFQVPIDYSREKTYEDFSITTPEGRQKAFGQHDHVRWYGKDYINRLRKSGFHGQRHSFN